MARFQSHRLHGGEEITIVVELLARLGPAEAEICGACNHHRHRHIHAGHIHPADPVHRIARRQERPGGGPGDIHEVQFDRRSGAWHAVDGSVTVIGHNATWRLQPCKDARAGIHGPDPDLGYITGCRNQPHFQRRRADPAHDVAAGRLIVDKPVLDADLGKEVVDIGPVILGPRQHRNLGRDRAATADAVDIQRMSGPDRGHQHIGKAVKVGRQVGTVHIGPARGTTTKKQKGDGCLGHMVRHHLATSPTIGGGCGPANRQVRRSRNSSRDSSYSLNSRRARKLPTAMVSTIRIR